MNLHPDVQRCHGKHCPNREGCARYEDRERGHYAFDNMCGPELQHRVTSADIARFHGAEIELLRESGPVHPSSKRKGLPNFPDEIRARAIALKHECPHIPAENIAEIIRIEFGREPGIETVYQWLRKAKGVTA